MKRNKAHFSYIFLQRSSIFEKVIRKRYGHKAQKFRKLEKLDYLLRKAQMDLEFPVNCNNNFFSSKVFEFSCSRKIFKVFENISAMSIKLITRKNPHKKYNITV